MANIVPASKEDIFLEDITGGAGVSEVLLHKIASAINAINHNYSHPIGEIMDSILPPNDFQEQMSNAWVLFDDREITNSDLGQLIINKGLSQYISGANLVYLKDMRGLHRVSHNSGRSDGKQHHANLPAGSFHEGQVKSHTHGFNAARVVGGISNFFGNTSRIANADLVTEATGAPQNTVNAMVVYTYIKIWNNPQ